ncbi:hypothetical protein HOG16_04435, partial [Candidatus Woesearchaeota archaeon]|nr:hypothetical protein [Candidatus Woesearchaeota archaeon]
TQIDKRIKNKRNPIVVKTIVLAKKNGLLDLAKKLSAPGSKYTKINLDGLNSVEGDKIMVIGKVLGEGDIERKIKISAIGFSESAKEKLKKAGCEIKTIEDEINKNKKLEGVKVI